MPQQEIEETFERLLQLYDRLLDEKGGMQLINDLYHKNITNFHIYIAACNQDEFVINKIMMELHKRVSEEKEQELTREHLLTLAIQLQHIMDNLINYNKVIEIVTKAQIRLELEMDYLLLPFLLSINEIIWLGLTQEKNGMEKLVEDSPKKIYDTKKEKLLKTDYLSFLQSKVQILTTKKESYKESSGIITNHQMLIRENAYLS